VPEPRRHRSLAGKVTALFLGILVVMAALSVAGLRLHLAPWLIFLLDLAVGLHLGAWLVHRLLQGVVSVVDAVDDGLTSLRDGDFSVKIARTRDDELGKLVDHYNEIVDVLRDERLALQQRELLLETALRRSPAAVVLTDGRDRVIYSNPEARLLFLGGQKLEGTAFADLAAGCPPSMQEVLAGGDDGLFTVEQAGESETYHLARRTFQLNRRRHTLYLLRRLTSEFSREEARIWKQVIRIISHELNNSLAPISSLIHSASLVAGRPEHHHRLPQIFASIEERLSHLAGFLEGYARFARLPKPQKERVDWRAFFDRIQELYPFELEGEPPSPHGYFDPGQLEQVMINLLKNAREAGGDGEGIAVRIAPAAEGGVQLQVLDRGTGMDEDVMRQALLPFYSTKKDGTGVGLAICREILSEHGGRLGLRSREGGGTVVTCWLPAR